MCGYHSRGDNCTYRRSEAPTHCSSSVAVLRRGPVRRFDRWSFECGRCCLGRMTVREIATQVHFSPEAIKTHSASIYRKLGVSTRRHVQDLAEANTGAVADLRLPGRRRLPPLFVSRAHCEPGVAGHRRQGERDGPNTNDVLPSPRDAPRPIRDRRRRTGTGPGGACVPLRGT